MFRCSYLLVVIVCFFISGCGTSAFTSRDTNPSIQDMTVAPHFWPWSPEALNTFATTSSRRLVLVKSTDYGENVISCAEPSPDVGEAFASAIANAIKIAAQVEGVPVELSNQYARTVATEITPLVYRTQGLQLYRDAMHNLCIDRMNGWVAKGTKGNSSANLDNPNSYERLRKYFFDESLKLINEELPIMKSSHEAFTERSKVGKAKVNIEDPIKTLKATTPPK